MRIEALENIKSGRFVLSAGDIVTVPDDDGAKWCAMGWAKDPEGVVPTGERSIRGVRIVPDKSAHAAKAAEVNHG